MNLSTSVHQLCADIILQNLGIDDPKRQATRALILVPTRELAEQVSAHLRSLLTYCEDEVSVANVSSGTTTHLQK